MKTDNKELIKLINTVVPKPMAKKEFDALSSAQKRVMISEDALALIRSNLVQVGTGTYFCPNDRLSYDTSATSDEGKCAIFGNNCHVCAKGALFVSTVMRTNKMSMRVMNRADTDEKVVDKEKIFSDVEFSLIEVAFEGSDLYCHYESGISYDIQDALDTVWDEEETVRTATKNMTKKDKAAFHKINKDVRAALAMFNKFEDSTERLTAILLNIIKNKGSFLPSKKITQDEVVKALAPRILETVEK